MVYFITIAYNFMLTSMLMRNKQVKKLTNFVQLDYQRTMMTLNLVSSYKPLHTKAFLGLLDCYKSLALYNDQLKEYNANKKRKNANVRKPKKK